MLLLYMKDRLEKTPDQAIREAQAEPPVVARLVIEIRSDGTRTIARGMAEDVAQGERVQIKAEGATPLQLVLSLVKSLRDVPAFQALLASAEAGRQRALTAFRETAGERLLAVRGAASSSGEIARPDA